MATVTTTMHKLLLGVKKYALLHYDASNEGNKRIPMSELHERASQFGISNCNLNEQANKRTLNVRIVTCSPECDCRC
jgi:hypothetical protein